MQQLSSVTEKQEPQKMVESRNIFFLADVGGTGFWRRILPIIAVDGIQHQTGVFNTYSLDFIPGARFYKDMNSVTVQRWITTP